MAEHTDTERLDWLAANIGRCGIYAPGKAGDPFLIAAPDDRPEEQREAIAINGQPTRASYRTFEAPTLRAVLDRAMEG